MSLLKVITGSTGDTVRTGVKRLSASPREHLAGHGAILFRGFDTPSIQEFGELVETFGGELVSYTERSSPRSSLGDGVYTSTEFPAHQRIFLHNENSYQRSWPSVLGFMCLEPASAGGETSLADCAAVLESLPDDVRSRFAEEGWRYERNFRRGLGLPWTEVFQTTSPESVDRYCADNGIETAWISSDHLRVSATRPAIHSHPLTGANVWFNHAAFFHVTTLGPDIAAGLRRAVPDALPSNSYFGSGAEVDDGIVAEIRRTYEAHGVSVEWQRGDCLVIDNMLMAHGRNSFTGNRRVVVAMAGISPDVGNA